MLQENTIQFNPALQRPMKRNSILISTLSKAQEIEPNITNIQIRLWLDNNFNFKNVYNYYMFYNNHKKKWWIKVIYPLLLLKKYEWQWNKYLLECLLRMVVKFPHDLPCFSVFKNSMTGHQTWMISLEIVNWSIREILSP